MLHDEGDTDQLASRVPGFLVVSQFNYTRLETEVRSSAAPLAPLIYRIV